MFVSPSFFGEKLAVTHTHRFQRIFFENTSHRTKNRISYLAVEVDLNRKQGEILNYKTKKIHSFAT